MFEDVKVVAKYTFVVSRLTVNAQVIAMDAEGNVLDQVDVRDVVFTPGKFPACVPLCEKILSMISSEDKMKLAERPLL